MATPREPESVLLPGRRRSDTRDEATSQSQTPLVPDPVEAAATIEATRGKASGTPASIHASKSDLPLALEDVEAAHGLGMSLSPILQGRLTATKSATAYTLCANWRSKMRSTVMARSTMRLHRFVRRKEATEFISCERKHSRQNDRAVKSKVVKQPEISTKRCAITVSFRERRKRSYTSTDRGSSPQMNAWCYTKQ